MNASKPHNRQWLWRTRVVMAGFALAAVGLMGRAVDLQILDDGFLTGQARARHQRVVEIPAHRGRILDRKGEPLAVSTPVDSIWAEPDPLLAQPGAVTELAGAIGGDAARLRQRLVRRAERQFVYIRRHMAPAEADKVMALGLPGVHVQREYRRYYPNGEVTAHVLGFTNIDDQGQEGLELAYNEWLDGEPGRKRILRDRFGHVIDDLGRLREARAGRDLTLSLDRRIQYVAYRELKSAVARHGAVSGSVVVLDVTTGEVLAMANQPSFNPNNRQGVATGHYRNRAVTDVFEPGSSFKPFVLAAALQAGVISPGSQVSTGPGWFMVQGKTIQDRRNFGRLTVRGVLRESSNVGMSKVALRTDPEDLWRTAQRLGFGQVTGSGFPGERTGHLSHYAEWQPIEQATFAYGYGVSVTPLQLAQAYAVIAADGIRRPVSLVKVTDKPAGDLMMDPGVAAQLRGMLEDVVGGGTGRRATIARYTVAGKTGTARKSAQGGYASDRYVAVFAGMAPARAPRLVTVVVINEPSGDDYYGGEVAAPTFSAVTQAALRFMDVPPDDLPAGGGMVIGPGENGELG